VNNVSVATAGNGLGSGGGGGYGVSEYAVGGDGKPGFVLVEWA
jgi:hypothetical protein